MCVKKEKNFAEYVVESSGENTIKVVTKLILQLFFVKESFKTVVVALFFIAFR
jgi:hypothetical protein